MSIRKLPLKSRVEFFRACEKYSRDNQDLHQLIRNKSARAKEKKLRNRDIFQSIKHRIDVQNMDIAEALSPHILPEESLYFKMAIEKGNVSQMLSQLVFLIEEKHRLQVDFIKALTKPVLVFIVSLILICIVIYVLVPKMGDIVRDESLLVGLGGYFITTLNPILQYVLPFILPMVFIGFLLSMYLMPHVKRSRLRNFLDIVLPHYSMYKKYTAAIMLVGMGSALASKMSLIEYFRLLRQTSSGYQESWSEYIFNRITSAQYEIQYCLDVGLFLESDMELIHDYLSSGGDASESLSIIGKEAVQRTSSVIMRQANAIFWTILGVIMTSVFVYSGYSFASVFKQLTKSING